MRQPYKPVIPMMVVRATADELVALGWVVTHYLQYLERSAQKTQEHRELIALLHSFQERVLRHSAYQLDVGEALIEDRKLREARIVLPPLPGTTESSQEAQELLAHAAESLRKRRV